MSIEKMSNQNRFLYEPVIFLIWKSCRILSYRVILYALTFSTR